MKNLIYTFLLLFIIRQDTAAQPFKGEELFGAMRARQIGPAVMSGRVTDLEAHPTNSKVYYAGAAGGGVWKTSNSGVTFIPVFEKHTQCIG